jgi:hypothetical protein
MNCVLCAAWIRTPFAARYNTPININDAQRLLAYGYTIHSHSPESMGDLCPAHAGIVGSFQKSIEELESAEAAANVPPPPAETAVRERMAQLHRQSQQKRTIGGRVAIPPPPPKVIENPTDTIVGKPAIIDNVPSFQCPKCGKNVAAGEVHPCT